MGRQIVELSFPCHVPNNFGSTLSFLINDVCWGQIWLIHMEEDNIDLTTQQTKQQSTIHLVEEVQQGDSTTEERQWLLSYDGCCGATTTR